MTLYWWREWHDGWKTLPGRYVSEEKAEAALTQAQAKENKRGYMKLCWAYVPIEKVPADLLSQASA